MNRKALTFTAAMILALSTSFAVAAPSAATSTKAHAKMNSLKHHAKKMRSKFASLDKNHNGSISKSEAKGNKMISGAFSKIDANHNGKISRQEMKQYAAKHSSKKGH